VLADPGGGVGEFLGVGDGGALFGRGEGVEDEVGGDADIAGMVPADFGKAVKFIAIIADGLLEDEPGGVLNIEAGFAVIGGRHIPVSGGDIEAEEIDDVVDIRAGDEDEFVGGEFALGGGDFEPFVVLGDVADGGFLEEGDEAGFLVLVEEGLEGGFEVDAGAIGLEEAGVVGGEVLEEVLLFDLGGGELGVGDVFGGERLFGLADIALRGVDGGVAEPEGADFVEEGLGGVGLELVPERHGLFHHFDQIFFGVGVAELAGYAGGAAELVEESELLQHEGAGVAFAEVPGGREPHGTSADYDDVVVA